MGREKFIYVFDIKTVTKQPEILEPPGRFAQKPSSPLQWIWS